MGDRDGMARLIAELRALTDVDVEDESFWTDEQLVSVLDQHSQDVIFLQLRPFVERIDGKLVYLRYYFPSSLQWLEGEETEGVFRLTDSKGHELSASFTYDPARRVIVFETDREGKAVYFTGRSFDMNASAARVWRIKAAQRAHLVRWRAGAHTVHQDQQYRHCIEQAELFERKGGFRTSVMVRTDYKVDPWALR
jgi:hypothetical protein